MLQPPKLDLRKTRTFSAATRRNLVRVDNLLSPDHAPVPPFQDAGFTLLLEKLREALGRGKRVTCFIGAHVLKCGLSRYLIRLMEMGCIHHLASNGAGSIHDFELAALGGTSEDVPTALQDGTFGMWEETGARMNEALQAGARQGWGYGESLARYAAGRPSLFPYLEDCVFYRAYQAGVPATYHVTIGADIIHQHPTADFGAIGQASGVDFAYFCASVAQLEGGVHLNFGSAVTGPEVFLKALSIARNQGHPTRVLTTANFDLIPLGDYKAPVGPDHFHYYYRPRKNIVNRPTACGGTGLYIQGNHLETLPNLYEGLRPKELPRNGKEAPV